jgi:plasmid stabilization system protein ParE
MKLEWTNEALLDMERLYEFLVLENKRAATQIVQSLITAPTRLLEQPRIGIKLKEFEPLEVRRIIAGHYELRYEIKENSIYLLRIWHTKEDR